MSKIRCSASQKEKVAKSAIITLASSPAAVERSLQLVEPLASVTSGLFSRLNSQPFYERSAPEVAEAS